MAVLAKGLIGVVFPCAIVFLFLCFTKRWRLLKEMRLATGIPLFLAIAAPWFVLVSVKNPEFARFFFIHEHFERFTTTVHGRYQPFWFFVPVLLGTMIPWSMFIPAAIRYAWLQRKSTAWSSQLYLIIWAVFIFMFFSKSDSKLIPYILPVFPALALLLGNAISKSFDAEFRPFRLSACLAGGVLTILGAGIILYPHFASNPAFSVLNGAIIGILFFCEGISTLATVRKENILALFIVFCFFSYLLGIIGPFVILPDIVVSKSTRELALQARSMAGKESIVTSFGYEQGLPFYAKRRVVVVGDRNELDFGSHQGDQSAWFVGYGGFKAIWDGKAPVYALLTELELSLIKGMVKTPIREIVRNSRKILITNR